MPFDEDLFGNDSPGMEVMNPSRRESGLANSSNKRKRRKPTPDNYRSVPSYRNDMNHAMDNRTRNPNAKQRQAKAMRQPPSAMNEDIRIKDNKKRAKTAAKQQKKRRTKENSISIPSKIQYYFKTHTLKDMFNDMFEWLDAHRLLFIPLAVIMIFIGVSLNRYISFASAVIMVVIGVLMNRKGYESTFYLTLLTGFLIFLIPYCF